MLHQCVNILNVREDQNSDQPEKVLRGPYGCCKSLAISFVCHSMIMSLSNALMYEGRLECGSEQTASAQIQLPCRDALEKGLYAYQPQYTAWVHAALDPQKSVCFLDTSQVCLTFSVVLLTSRCTIVARKIN